jgi:hypothetical protein
LAPAIDSWLALPLQMCRHVFVEERSSLDAVEGPPDDGAAMIMGNSVQMWQKRSVAPHQQTGTKWHYVSLCNTMLTISGTMWH